MSTAQDFYVSYHSLAMAEEQVYQSSEGTSDERLILREQNLDPKRPSDVELKQLDGSLKRNNTMTRKLRAITEAAKDQLLEEIGRLNMLKYLDEAVASIAEGKLKAADLNACVMVCSKLHQRYANFSSLLGPVLAKLATGGPASDTGEPISVQQRKLKLRLLAELVFVSVVDDEKLLVNAVRELSSAADPSSVVEGGGGALAILASFAKNCASDLFSNEVSPLSGEHIATLKRCLESCFESAKQMLHKEHDRLETIERENSHAMDTRGEISSEASAAYERARNSFDSLHRNVSMLAEGLDKEMPQISPDEQTHRFEEDSVEQINRDGSGDASRDQQPLWDDEISRDFYENLVQLSDHVPPEVLNQKREEAAQDSSKSFSTGPSESGDKILNRLPKCVSKSSADDFAIEFCFVATKSMRRKLIRELVHVPAKEMQLLPQYARIAATLSEVHKDVGQGVVSALEENFQHLFQKKDQIDLDNKLRTVRFLGELCKFRVAPPGTIFACLKACYDDFTHHNVDAACALLESCGRFLCRLRETATRANNMLSILRRLKNAKNLDQRQSALVDSAYFHCRPPERKKQGKDKSWEELYVEHLFCEVLDKKTVDMVVTQLRKLNWSEWREELVRKALEASTERFLGVAHVASITAGLGRHRDDFSIALVDDLLERVREGLETESPTMAQERVAHVRLLGELFKARVVSATLVFDTLYTILFFGHSATHPNQNDPRWYTMRVQLAITLTNACGRALSSQANRQALARFVAHLWRYSLSKEGLPKPVKFDLNALASRVNSALLTISSMEEAAAECARLDNLPEPTETLPDDSQMEDEGGHEEGVELDDVQPGSVRAWTGPSREEEEDFQKEFNSVMAELGGVSNFRARPAARQQEARHDPNDEEESDPEGSGNTTLPFKVLAQKSSSSSKTLHLPSSSAFAQPFFQSRERQEQERQELKNLTLELSHGSS